MNPLGQPLLGNRYEVLEKLGQGGMGEVYKGRDTQTERFVAIKQVRSTIAGDTTVIERFRREGQALSDLNHPNIVKMLDMIQQNDEYFLVTEFIEGGDLAELLSQLGKLSVSEALKMGLELADALSRAHHLGIIHRDIKPANVLIAKDGTPRLTDFGVAHMKSKERLTGTGMAVGTMDYLPPEAVNGDPVDARADIWSFGVMIYEMVTGERPFQGTTTMQLLNNILTADAQDISEYSPEAPPALNELIQNMLRKDRQARIRSARQVGAALEAILQGDDTGIPLLQTPSRPIPGDTRSLADLPTTPGIPVQNLPTAKRRTWGKRLRRTREKRNQGQPRLLWGALMLVLVAFFVLAAFSFWPTTTFTSPTPSPEPTATDAPTRAVAELSASIPEITETAPEGYKWISIGDAQYIVPTTWISYSPELFLQLIETMLPESAAQAAMTNYLEQQSETRFTGSIIDFTAFITMLEDAGIVLPDDVLIARLDELMQVADDNFTFEQLPESRETRLGTALYASGIYRLGGRQENSFHIEMYMIYRGTQLYSFGFSSPLEHYEERKAIFDTIFSSIRFTDSSSTPEATEIVIPNMPGAWLVAQGERTAFAVPVGFVITNGSNQALLDASVNLIMGGNQQGQTVNVLFDQINIDALAGRLLGKDIFFASTIFQESPLSSDLDTALGIVQGMFTVIADNGELSFETLSSERMILPAGETIRVDNRIGIPERPDLRSIFYVLMDDEGITLYAIAFSFLDTESERMIPLAEAIAQTFMILD